MCRPPPGSSTSPPEPASSFQESGDDEIKIVLAWLDGYYRDEKDPPIIDTDRFIANGKKLGEFCSANPNVGLITATDKVTTHLTES